MWRRDSAAETGEGGGPCAGAGVVQSVAYVRRL
jgi:hypothetical protein